MMLVRLIIQTEPTVDGLERLIFLNQKEGLRVYGKGSSMRIITLKRGGWLRSIWRAWQQQRLELERMRNVHYRPCAG